MVFDWTIPIPHATAREVLVTSMKEWALSRKQAKQKGLKNQTFIFSKGEASIYATMKWTYIKTSRKRVLLGRWTNLIPIKYTHLRDLLLHFSIPSCIHLQAKMSVHQSCATTQRINLYAKQNHLSTLPPLLWQFLADKPSSAFIKTLHCSSFGSFLYSGIGVQQ